MNYCNLFVCFGIGLFFQNLSYAQVAISPNNAPPDPSAALDINYPDRGLLIPRLTSAQRDAIPSPAPGLQIFNTDTECLQIYFSTGMWRSIICACDSFPNASFTAPVAVINQPTSFSPAVSGLAGYQWTFQNGTPGSSSAPSPQVTWSSTGTYGVSLTVTDTLGCSSTHTDSVQVVQCPPNTLTFTNCGKTGDTGPSQSQCDAAYGASGIVTVSSGIQQWVVPCTRTYTITALGAEGGTGSYAGGLGAKMSGQFNLNQGDILNILVGQMGSSESTGNGGGGTFVVIIDPSSPYTTFDGKKVRPLIIAGGGGGGAGTSDATIGPGVDGTINTCGTKDRQNMGNPGCNGNGGETGGGSGNTGGGGGGFLTNGISNSTTGKPGFSYLNGGAGAMLSTTVYGGFGGGGSQSSSNVSGPAGENYSGGAGGNRSSSRVGGGGGGSYNDGTNQDNQSGFNSGHGKVIISW